MTGSVRTIAVYTTAHRRHALAILRIVDPLERAGIRILWAADQDGFAPELTHQADAVLVQRDFPRQWRAYQQARQIAAARKIPVIYDLDDHLLQLHDDHPDRLRGHYNDALLPMLHAIHAADVVTTSSPALRCHLSAFNPNVHCVPNYLNERLWPLRTARPARSGAPVVLGYVGTVSHQPDVEDIAPVLEQVLNHYGDRVVMKFWVVRPPHAVRRHPRVQWIPSVSYDYAAFAEYFNRQRLDVFIAPLRDTAFNRFKSAIKFCEYSALAVPGVYANMPPYADVVDHGDNGFLAATPAEWWDSLSRLIEEPALRETVGRNARDTMQREWSLAAHAPVWLSLQPHLVHCVPEGVRAAQVHLVEQLVAQLQSPWRLVNQRLGRMSLREQRLADISAMASVATARRLYHCAAALLRWPRALLRPRPGGEAGGGGVADAERVESLGTVAAGRDAARIPAAPGPAQIYVVFHRDFPWVRNQTYLPIYAGRILCQTAPDLPGDDVGQNISAKNPHYSELTALYWIWKNAAPSAYVGLCHYRRYFDFRTGLLPRPHLRHLPVSAALLNRLTGPQVAAARVAGLDIILPTRIRLASSIEFDYHYHHVHEDWDLMLEALRKVSPEYFPGAARYFKEHNRLHAFNMMIMRWPIFERYCAWLFGILFEMEKSLSYTAYTYQKRVPAFIAERLLNLYIWHNLPKESWKIKEYPVVFLEESGNGPTPSPAPGISGA